MIHTTSKDIKREIKKQQLNVSLSIKAMNYFSSSEFEPTEKDKFEKHEDLKKEVIN